MGCMTSTDLQFLRHTAYTSGTALSMHQRLTWFIHQQVQNLRKENEHQAYSSEQYGTLLPFWHWTENLKKLEAIQRWSEICCVWPWTLTYQKFLLCIS